MSWRPPWSATPGLGTAVSSLFARLHDAGVYFRGLHFGNVIVDGEVVRGLVDVTDVRFRPWPLGVSARARNFKPFLRYPEDRAILTAWQRWLDESIVTLREIDESARASMPPRLPSGVTCAWAPWAPPSPPRRREGRASC